jgi:hypothetical protein
MRERPLALGEERLRQVVKGTPAVFAAVAFEARSVMIDTPGTNRSAVRGYPEIQDANFRAPAVMLL